MDAVMGEKQIDRGTTHVSASEVKNSWHEYVDRVSRGREVITVTRYGKSTMQLVPITDGSADSGVFGSLRGSVRIVGDIVAPRNEAWEAEE